MTIVKTFQNKRQCFYFFKYSSISSLTVCFINTSIPQNEKTRPLRKFVATYLDLLEMIFEVEMFMSFSDQGKFDAFMPGAKQV
ncbi:Methyltransferase-like protein [Daphnia magna]|uniref:Methyltransferase-like protein n=1 Tax=Daphnia magna TaxID=35525 RepID=A0A162NEI2_9CRUS|nr:Methyltransferase-like protein [Daphnia magna]